MTEAAILNYLKQVQTRVPPGVNITGDLTARLRALSEMVGIDHGDISRIITEVGDTALDFGNIKISQTIPIAYDMWYLFDYGNALEFGLLGEADEKIEASMVALTLFFTALGNPLPLRAPDPAIWKEDFGYWYFEYYGETPTFAAIGEAKYTVKEARYEAMLQGQSEKYPSERPKEPDGQNYAGYIAFPVGPLGVMSVISLVTESMFSVEEGKAALNATIVPVGGSSAVIPDSGNIIPPWNAGVTEVAGQNLVIKGYVIEDHAVIEYYADKFAGVEINAPEMWMRYWIKRDNNLIMPGEFVGLLCRPWPVHCWWMQESSPFVHSGNWIETEFYTSGVVISVVEPAEGEVGKTYTVLVKNEEVEIKSSDFLEYEVEDRVGIIKRYREVAGTTELDGNFDWEDLVTETGGAALDWVIVPVGFYGTQES